MTVLNFSIMLNGTTIAKDVRQMAMLQCDQQNFFLLQKLDEMKNITPLAGAKSSQLGSQIQTYLDQ